MNKLPKPIPAGGIDRYNEERELCLSLNNKKKENYDRYLVSKEGRNSVLDYLPIKLDIENVSRCNFRCQMCQVSGWEKAILKEIFRIFARVAMLNNKVA